MSAMYNDNNNDNNDNNNNITNWFEESIENKSIKFFNYNDFKNVEVVGYGTFSQVSRVNLKNLKHPFALKSFFKFDNITLKEVVREIQLHKELGYHETVIRFYGITKIESAVGEVTNYSLVMEYADGGSLRDYLIKENRTLGWHDKLVLAHQLATSVQYLHDDGFAHRDLHSCNVLVHQNRIKLADFGLSKRIDETNPKLLGMVSYTDPGVVAGNYSFGYKSDVYSIGVLLWEISKGKPPFEGENTFNLMTRILQGTRELSVPGTPSTYCELYTECWDDDLEKRPSMLEVVNRLDSIYEQLNIDNIESTNEQLGNLNNIDNINNIDSIYKQLINEIIDIIYREVIRGSEWDLIRNQILEHFSNIDIDIDAGHFYGWLDKYEKDINNSNSTFVLGYCYYVGIGRGDDPKVAFNLFTKASKDNHALAIYYMSECFEFGYGVPKNDKSAFKHCKKISDTDVIGQLKMGWYYDNGFGVKKDLKTAVQWYEKAVNNGNLVAMYNLGLFYENGTIVNLDNQKAFELYEKSAEGGCVEGIVKLADCYVRGLGTEINEEKAADLYAKAARFGNTDSQYSLAKMYENGEGVNQSIEDAIYWYEQAAQQKNRDAIKALKKLKPSGDQDQTSAKRNQNQKSAKRNQNQKQKPVKRTRISTKT